MELIAIPAFEDNYIWMLQHDGRAVVVDPGDAAPVIHILRSRSLVLDSILVTHHHADHVGGVPELLDLYHPHVHGPALENLAFAHQPHFGGETLSVLGQATQVMSVPGHTAGHLAYMLTPQDQTPILFCGDTLFSGGCGRLFEGTPAQMMDSLDQLAALDGRTRVCCAHEYTLGNLRFALAVEPGNTQLQSHYQHCQQQRQQGLSTLPSSIALERQINPFLRTRVPEVIHAAHLHQPHATQPAEVLAVLREWKNRFK